MAAQSASHSEPSGSRTSNALECALACLSTWFGQPRGARALVFDPNDPLSTLRGEVHGRDRAEAWVGARFEYLGPDAVAYEVIADRLIAGGHGTAAVIVNGWPPHLGTGTHAWNAANYQGRVDWVDAQWGEVGGDPLYPEPYGVWAMFIDKLWRPPR